MTEARERLQSARDSLEADHAGTAASAAYYAMLYAARAALSEQDKRAKTHRGIWHVFREQFVLPGRFEQETLTMAQRAQSIREQSDYEAESPTADEAAHMLGQAEEFVAAVEQMLADAT
jgi:uncharacterized protein (UPF0332 family)